MRRATLERREDLVSIGWFGHVIDRADFDRFDCVGDAAIAGQDHGTRIGRDGQQVFQQLHTHLARHLQIQHRHVRFELGRQFDRHVVTIGAHDRQATFGERLLQAGTEHIIVIDN